MRTDQHSPYITEWMPLVGGFKPMQIIHRIHDKCFSPRHPKRYIMNEMWLKNEMKRCVDIGVKCFIEYKKVGGLTVMALKEGEEN